MQNIMVSVQNFGPIEKGTVVIRPLTIFLGRNNTGKSYLAMLTHTFLESLLEFSFRYGLVPYLARDPRLLRRGFFEQPQRRVDEWLKHGEKVRPVTEILELIKRNLSIDQPFELPERFSQELHSLALHAFEREFEKFFKEELERIFGCKVSELCCHSKQFMKMNFKLNNLSLDFECQGDDIHVKTTLSTIRKIIFEVTSESGVSFGVRRVPSGKPITVSFSSGLIKELEKEGKTKFFRDIFFNSLLENIMRHFLSWELNYSNYLPAARSGILAGHKALASGLLRQLRYVGFERMEFFPLSGTVTDFLASILQIQRRKGDFPKLASFLEDEIAEGRIIIKEIEKLAYPEIFYEFEKHELPLHRSSSMVSELAPLVLFLKYIITPNSTLVIEEPESHLHPAAQRKLAELLARLVNRSVRVILTSHSDYLLHQIQNLVFLSRLNADKLRRLKRSKKNQLSFDNVAVYLFQRTAPRMTQIKTVDIHDTTLKDSGFNEVVEELYGESVKIDRILKKNKQKAPA